MSVFIKRIFHKLICLFERAHLRIIFKGDDIYQWHIQAPYHCREYKIDAVKIINSLKPGIVIDIGCGLGDVISRIDINPKNKFGFDKDKRLGPAIQKLYRSKSNFLFFSNEDLMKKTIKNKLPNSKGPLVITMLNFLHFTPEKKLSEYINSYRELFGPLILVIDGIERISHEFPYAHSTLLSHQHKVIYFSKNIDQIRSLYCIDLRYHSFVTQNDEVSIY